MLPRAAVRAFRSRNPSSALTPAFTPQWRRQYARSEKPRAPPKPQAERPEILSEETAQGPVKNRTWSPDKGIRFAGAPSAQSQQGTVLEDESLPGTPEYAKDPIEDLKSDILPQSSASTKQEASSQATASDVISQPPPTSTGSSPAPASESKLRRASEGPSTDEPSLTGQSTGPLPDLRQGIPSSADSLFSDKTSDPSAAANAQPAQSQQSPGPLPDLRQGIPSTFEQDFSDRSSSFKDKDAEVPALNLTEDPAAGGGKRGGGGEEGARQEYVSSIERRRNMLATLMYLGLGSFATVGALILGRGWDDDEAALHPNAPNGWTPGAVYTRVKERLGGQLGYYTEPAFPKLLPDMDPNMRAPYTLVLSLEDLLISSKWDRNKGWQVAKRPGVDYFLRYLSQYYELVIFTSVSSVNADLVIRKLDPFRIVSWPLFREGTRYMNGEHVKDLSYLNRDLSKTIMVDTHAPHVQLQPENAIILPKWGGTRADANTTDLVALIPFLEYIAGMSIEDVRKVLKSYEGTHIPTEFHRRETLAREAFNKRLAEEKAKSPRGGSAIGGLAGLLGIKPSPPMMSIPGEPSVAEGFAQGKMLSDQMRERGQRNYEALEKEIRENGAKWLAEMEAEEKKAQEEQMKSMQSGVLGFFGGGGAPPGPVSTQQ